MNIKKQGYNNKKNDPLPHKTYPSFYYTESLLLLPHSTLQIDIELIYQAVLTDRIVA